MSLVRLNICDNIATLVLADPSTRNAMGEVMQKDFVTAVSSLRASQEPYNVVVITGDGDVFSAGGDLAMLEAKAQQTPAENLKTMRSFYESFLSIREIKVPLVAAINGHAIGAALCLACACDLRLVSNRAKLGFTFSRLGLFPGMASTYLLPRLVGSAAALDFLMTGRIFSAQEAFQKGLVTRVVEESSFENGLQELIQELREASPFVLQQLIETFRVITKEESLSEALDREATCQSVSYSTADFLEGIKATREKRRPQFTGK
jgi:enoyl-CoA hydratase